MLASPTQHTRTTRLARRISASSGSPLALPKASPCVLNLLGQSNLQAHRVGKAGI
jgi:hypothetical protein